MHEELGVPDEPQAISAEVVRRLLQRYRERLPLIAGAAEAVERLASHWPLGVASSSNREVIDAVLDALGARPVLPRDGVVGGGAAREAGAGRLPRGGAQARRGRGRCAAVEDSHNGIRSARAAGMRVVAIPNPTYPPGDDALAEADVVLRSLDELTPDAITP